MRRSAMSLETGLSLSEWAWRDVAKIRNFRQRTNRYFNFGLSSAKRNHGLQDYGTMLGNQLGHSLESTQGGEADGNMLPLRIYFAHVNLPQPPAESSQHLDRDPHRGINLSCMPNIKAE